MHGALKRSTVVLGVLALGLVAALTAAAGPGPPGGAYEVTPLVSDIPGVAPLTDPELVNAWGLTRSPTSPWWVADNGPDPGTSKSTLYTGGGAKVLSVNVLGGPTGDVFAGVPGNFQIGTDTDPTALAPAKFIFATENGDLRAWQAGSTALVAPATGIDAGAKFKGLAIAQPTPGTPLLYAADFHNAEVDVFNGSWQNVRPHGAFVDRRLPRGYAPFGIQTIGTDIFVTYGKQDAEAGDEVDGQGLGFVDEYDLSGKLVARVAQRGRLDAPWGLAMAPASFGRFKGDLLVGNFGDGQINAYAGGHGHGHGPWHHVGTLRSSGGGKLVIDRLWALEFGNAGSNGDPDTLFFTAGPNDESDGLFGTIKPG
jgi:uncharacterized protein (TIGR03118 family)